MTWEKTLLLWIHAHHSPALDQVFLFSRWFGETFVLTIVVVAAAALALFFRRTRLAVTWLVAGLVTFGLGWGLKTLVGRSRPHLWPWLVHPHDASFPSGHALGTSMVFSLFAATLPGVGGTTGARVAAALLILYVGVGRLYLGVHWPTDVLGGWALGLTISALAQRYAHRTHTKKS